MAATGTNDSLTVLETLRVSPPPNTVGERSLPLTFFDFVWLIFHPIHQLFFYEFPHTTDHFIQTVLPNLKNSLSITLQHFFPFAGNLIVFPESNPRRKPEIRYVEGDSIALTTSESNLDFHDLIRNHPRDCNKFYPLVPLLEGAFKESDFVKIPIFSIQITIFPNSGISIGFTNHHSLCDARTRYDFLRAWTSISKTRTDESFLASGFLQFYDRVIEYPSSLDEIYLNVPGIQNLDENFRAPQLVHQPDRVRATLVLTRSQINRLKKSVLARLPIEFVSSFVVGCAFTWRCVAKSRVQFKGNEGEYELERFGCVIDWRTRMDPPVPQTYFGNCGGIAIAQSETARIIGPDGLSNAVEFLHKAITETVKNKEGMFKDAEMWLERAFLPIQTITVAGTPKLNVYEVDFGWGKPEKYETVSIDFSDAISVNVSKDSPEDLEIGLGLPAKQMDAFVDISKNELEIIVSEQE